MFLLATGTTVLHKYESPEKSDRLPTGEFQYRDYATAWKIRYSIPE